MKLPSPAEWDRIHSLSDDLEDLPAAEKKARLEALATSEDPLIYSCLRAHFLVPEPMAETDLAPGTLVAGKYEIRERIGEGGMGIVYRATQRRTGRDIALKAIRPRMVSPALRTRFEREVANLARLHHPSLVRLFDADVFTDTGDGEQLFYTMDLVEGERLDIWIRDSGASLERRLVLLEKICRGVQAAHEQGVVHRDLKPQNILVEKGDQPVILDFGLARLRGELVISDEDDEEATIAPIISLLSGTPAYMDPDANAHIEAGESADIYALGVIAFETLTGRLPFDLPESPSLRQVREAVSTGKRHNLRAFLPKAPASLDAVIQQALRRRPVDRYPSAALFADALLDQAKRGQRLRRRTFLSVTLGSFALLSLTAAVFAWNARHESEKRRAQAVRAEKQSDGLVEFMLKDLRARLEPLGRLDILEPVIEKAVTHYKQRRIDDEDSDESLLALASALQIKGNVLGVRGKAAEAEQGFRAAIDITRAIRDRKPAAPEAHLAVATSLRKLGDHLMRRGGYPEALVAYTEADSEIAATLALAPDLFAARHQQAAIMRCIGDAYAYHLDQLDKAQAAYSTSRDLYDKLLPEYAEDRLLREERALLETSMGSLDETLEDFPGMLRHFTAYHDYVLKTHGAGSLSFAHSAFRMGVASVKTGDFSGALTYLEPAVKLAETNNANNPNETESLKLLSTSLRFLVRAHEGLNQATEADSARQRLAAIGTQLNRLLAGVSEGESEALPSEMERLLRESTDDEEWSRFVYKVRARIEAEHPNADRRIAAYQEWLNRVATLQTATGEWHSQLALAASSFHNRIADALLASGQAEAAVAAFDQAYALRRTRWEKDPDSLRTQLDLLSSTAHRLGAKIKAKQETETFSAARDFLEVARAQSPGALASNRHGLAKAIDFADSSDAARALWPNRANEWHTMGAELVTLILDRLPDGGGKETLAVETRARLSRP
jgi:serine/threonine protein kinase